MMRARLRSCVSLLAVTASTLVGCGASEAVGNDAATTTGEGRTTYPLTIENCGIEQTFTAAPARVVSLDQGSTELLLSLGLADRIVGTASWTDPVLDSLAEANATVPRLADNAPSYEAVMGTDPDFVTASFGRHLKEQGGVATRARFAESGIPSYLSPTDCEDGRSINGGAKRSAPITIESLYQEITDMAAVFDVPSRGERLVNDLKQRVAQAKSRAPRTDRTVAFWFADTKTPYIGGAFGSTNLITEIAGARTAFPEIADDWAALSWTSMVERSPDVIVLGDLARNRFPGDKLVDKKAFLASDPVTAVMPAVAEQRYVALHGAEMNPSIRMVDGIEKLVDWLADHPQ